jgi:hypothetical protein
MASPGQTIQIAMPRTAATNEQKALPNAAKFTAARRELRSARVTPKGTHNQLVLHGIFLERLFVRSLRRGEATGYSKPAQFREQKMRARLNQLLFRKSPMQLRRWQQADGAD